MGDNKVKWINGECDVYDSVAATSLLENTGNTQQGFNEVMFWVRTLIVLLMGLTGKNMIQFLWLYTHFMKDWWTFVGGGHWAQLHDFYPLSSWKLPSFTINGDDVSLWVHHWIGMSHMSMEMDRSSWFFTPHLDAAVISHLDSTVMSNWILRRIQESWRVCAGVFY